MYSKKYCMFCKKIIPKDIKICPACGKDLNQSEYQKKERCRYCNILIPINGKYCEYCGTSIIKNSVNIDDEKIFEYKTTFVCAGGNCFDKNLAIHVFLKNGKIDLQTWGQGNKHFDIKKDFVLCEKLSKEKVKSLRLLENKNYVMLIFNEFSIILENDFKGEEIISKIYENIGNQVYETENIFYNTEHEKFTIF